MNQCTLRIACVALTCLLAAGCGSKLTADRFDRIKEGMTLSQVKSILGKPHNVVPLPKKGQMLGWQSGNSIVMVMMLDGKVLTFEQENLP